MPSLQTEFLQDGAQTATAVAGELEAFIASATRTIDVAIYDFQANVGATEGVGNALEQAAAHGVKVRVVFNATRPHPHRPPWSPPPKCQPEEIEGLDVPTHGVTGEGTLMHHKYLIRDDESVWTGSLNWTDDAFGREENVVVRLDAPAIARAFAANFEQLWATEKVERSGGKGSAVPVDGITVEPFFAPKGPSLAHVVASVLGGARRRIRVLSPVITAGPVLGTLAEFAGRGAFDFGGAYDLTQMEQVQTQWQEVPANHWKIHAWKVIAERMAGKRSTPYSNTSVHDYMHAKAVVVDDHVLTGSYNLSRGGGENAENLLRIEGGGLAERFASFADQVAERYRRQPIPTVPAPVTVTPEGPRRSPSP